MRAMATEAALGVEQEAEADIAAHTKAYPIWWKPTNATCRLSTEKAVVELLPTSVFQPAQGLGR